MTDSWNAELSREIYAVEHWGEGYFNVGAAGNVIVCPTRDPAQGGERGITSTVIPAKARSA